MLWTFLSHSWTFMTIPSAKRKIIYEHLWLHWWSFMTKKSAKRKKPKTSYDLFWPKNREAQNRRTFMLHRWLFLTKTKYKRVGVFVFSYSKTRPNKNDIDNQPPSNKRSIHLLNNSAKKRRIVKLSSFKIVAYKRKIVLL